MKLNVNLRDLLVREIGESPDVPATINVEDMLDFTGTCHKQEIDLDELLAENRMIAHVWTTDDVRQVRPELTDDQAWRVLQACEEKLDSEQGLTWDTIDQAAQDIFGPGAEFRADRCEKAIRGYSGDDDIETCLTDLLADARHWCDAHEQSFAEIDRRAYEHYVAERNGEE